jgi:hypothetical protein
MSPSNKLRDTLAQPPSTALLKFVLAALGFGGSALMLTELLLIKHHNVTLQLVAPTAAGIGLLTSFVPAVTRNRVARGLVVLVGLGLMLVGGIGVVIHFSKNLEVIKNASLLEVLSGPYPSLAPLALANIGAVMLLTVWVSTQGKERA